MNAALAEILDDRPPAPGPHAQDLVTLLEDGEAAAGAPESTGLGARPPGFARLLTLDNQDTTCV